MADSSVIRISHTYESELKELDRTPPNRSPMRGTPVATPPRFPATVPTTPTQSTPVIDRTLSSAANLVKLLPSGTVLAFQILSPSFTNKGICYTSNKYLTSVLIHVCAISCVFFSFTDSFVGRDGKLYYGISTPKGFYVFNYSGSDEDRAKVFGDMRRFRMRMVDYVHALFSVVVFLAITFSDANIQNCFFPSAGKNTKQLLVNFPLGAGFLSSIVFMLFPTSRKSIGYSDGAPTAQ